MRQKRLSTFTHTHTHETHFSTLLLFNPTSIWVLSRLFPHTAIIILYHTTVLRKHKFKTNECVAFAVNTYIFLLKFKQISFISSLPFYTHKHVYFQQKVFGGSWLIYTHTHVCAYISWTIWYINDERVTKSIISILNLAYIPRHILSFP